MKQKVKRWTRYNYLMWLLVKKNIKSKYRRSVLGVVWNILLPMLEMLIMSWIFGIMMGMQGTSFRIFVMAGVIIFGIHRESTVSGMYSIINNKNLIDKIYIPPIMFPLASCFTAFANFLFSFFALLVVVLFNDISIFSPYMLLIVVMLPALFLFSAGVSIFLSALIVFFRDIGHLYTIVIMMWMYLSAIFFDVTTIENYTFVSFIRLNPMFRFIDYFRSLLIYHTIPDITQLAVLYAFGLISMIVSTLFFELVKKHLLIYA